MTANGPVIIPILPKALNGRGSAGMDGSLNSATDDAVLIDLDKLGVEAARGVVERHRSSWPLYLVGITSSNDRDALRRYLDLGLHGLASPGATASEMERTLATCRYYEDQVGELRGRITALQQRLEEVKLIQRAKAILANRAGISDVESLRRMRHESRSRRCRMSETAKRIIDADQSFKEAFGSMCNATGHRRTKRQTGQSGSPILECEAE